MSPVHMVYRYAKSFNEVRPICKLNKVDSKEIGVYQRRKKLD